MMSNFLLEEFVLPAGDFSADKLLDLVVKAVSLTDDRRDQIVQHAKTQETLAYKSIQEISARLK